MRKFFSILGMFVLASTGWAHNTDPAQGGTLSITYGGTPGTISVTPFATGDSCLVIAQASEIVVGSPLVSIQNKVAQPAWSVYLSVTPIRHPVNQSETRSIQLSWSATGVNTAGAPDPGCTGSGAAIFNVTVTEPPLAPPASSSANMPSAGLFADPVNTATGELYFTEKPDLYLHGLMPLRFSRYYAAFLRRNGFTAPALGNNWRHAYEMSLTTSSGVAEVVDSRGRNIRFVRSGTSWTLTGNTETPFQLADAAAGYVLGDPRTGLLYSFDTAGKLTRIEDGKGNSHTLSYSGTQLTGVADGLGRGFSLSYDAAGHLSSVSDGTRSVSYTYGGDNLTGYTDALGNFTSYSYDSANANPGLLTRKTLPLGNAPYAQTYDNLGRVATQTDADGNRYTFAYTALTTTITDPSGKTQVETHDSQGQLVAHTDESAQTYTLSYDNAGHRLSIVDRIGASVSYTYHSASGKPASATDATGNTATLTYTSRSVRGITFYDLATFAYPDGTSESYQYDAAGNLLSTLDQAGKRWTYTYQGQGQLASATNPAGGVSAYTYNAAGMLASATDNANNVVNFAYDTFNRLVRITHPDATYRAFTYDRADQITSVTDERGKTSTFGYDKNGNIVSLTDPLGNVTRLAYDGRDWLTGITDPAGATSQRSYDNRGRLSGITDRNGNSMLLAYDVRSHLTSIRDGGGKVWTRSSNAEGTLTGATDPLNNAVAYTVDAMGRVTTAVTPLGLRWVMGYDQMYRASEVANPLGQKTAFTYENRGLLSRVTLPGASASFTYNELGRLTKYTDLGGADWQYAYDAQGRLTSTTDPNANTTEYAYDTRNRIDQIRYPKALGTLNVSYNGDGSIARKQYSDGTGQTMGYDAAGRLTSATGLDWERDVNGRLIRSNGIVIGRDAGGRIISVTLAAGKTVTYTYDGRNLLVEIKDWLNGITSLGYDAAGRLTTLARPNGVTTNYRYDADSRVIEITEGTLASTVLTLDGAGLVLSANRRLPALVTLDSTSTTMSYDRAAQIASVSYDALGRPTIDGERRYNWNLASHLTGYSEGSSDVAFTYDAAGYRLSRTNGGLTRGYVWNYAFTRPSVALERQGENDVRYYVHLPSGMLLYSIEAVSGQRRYYHYDESGSTIFLTDAIGAVTDSYAYTPYGTLTTRAGTSENLFTFGGAYGVMQEGSGGLYYMRARYYDAARGRFLSREPMRSLDPRSMNPYQYAQQNPVGAIDPLGRDRDIVIGGHEWIKVDRYDAQGNVIGQMSLHFAPEGAGKSSFTWNHPRNDPDYPHLHTIHIKSSRLEDELLFMHWAKLAQDNQTQKWTVALNCAWATFTYAYADATKLEPEEALKRAKQGSLPANTSISAAPPDPWYKTLSGWLSEGYNAVENGLSKLID